MCAVSWGSYFDHALAWEKRLDDPNVKVITYEELKEVESTLAAPFRQTGSCSFTRKLDEEFGVSAEASAL